jgi:DNA polymerase/3'-5' exonuclease PolX
MASINSTIVDEFNILVNMIKIDIDNAKKNKDTKVATANSFRLRQINNAIATIKNYPEKLTLDNIDEFKDLPGIGKGTIDRIVEIIKTNKLAELDTYKSTQQNKSPAEKKQDEMKAKTLAELESIVGVGRSNALELIQMGVTSVDDLKNKIADGTIEVNEKIMLGIKYFGKFQGNIPREEITKINKIISKIIDKLNKKFKLDDTNKYVYEICGSYRREKPTSGDIDILVSKMTPTEGNHLDYIIQELKKPIKGNNDKPLIIDDMTSNYETKYMGFAQYKDNPPRRIDVRYIEWPSYHSALLYFTGSAELNKKMRQIAKTMGYKLSEYGLTSLKDNKMVPIESEYDVFKILKIEYLPPRLR